MGLTEAQSAPSYSWSGAVAGKTYLALSLDLHAPFPSLPILGPILHGMQTGLTASSGSPQLGTDVSPIVRYVPPGPPPFSGPHRYVFLLYEEPADFDAKKFKPQGEGQEFPRLQRIRFDINGFVKEAGLGDVLAGGWFESN